MSTSVTAHKLHLWQKWILIDLAVTLFCILFGAVYEAFSHGVYAYGMLYAFVFPLVLGVLPLTLITMFRKPFPNCFVRSVWHAGIATLTVGSFVSGALKIYGTTNPLTLVYWIAGSALVLIAAAAYLVSAFRAAKAVEA